LIKINNKLKIIFISWSFLENFFKNMDDDKLIGEETGFEDTEKDLDLDMIDAPLDPIEDDSLIDDMSL
jgi:hypothetical protein